MAESGEGSKASNGPAASEDLSGSIAIESAGGETLYDVLSGFIAGVVSPEATVSPPPTLVQRLRDSFRKSAPRLREASRNSAHDLLLWTRRGSPLRALLVISVGTITLLALSGLLVFMLFFLAATLNAIIISFLVSLAAAGGFLALFFACLTAIYIGALSVAIFVVSTTTISTIIAVVIATGYFLNPIHRYANNSREIVDEVRVGLKAVIKRLLRNVNDQIDAITQIDYYNQGLGSFGDTIARHAIERCKPGWVGFFWIIWLAAKKSMNLTKQSLTMTSSAISAYAAARQSRRDASSKPSD